MSFRDWETDIEFFEVVGGKLIPQIDEHFEELPFDQFNVQDSVVKYFTSREREVRMRIMGFAALNPIVTAHITSQNGKEQIRRGELVGCRHPEEKIILPGTLRTLYFPVIREFGQGLGMSALPTPLYRLRASKPRS